MKSNDTGNFRPYLFASVPLFDEQEIRRKQLVERYQSPFSPERAEEFRKDLIQLIKHFDERRDAEFPNWRGGDS